MPVDVEHTHALARGVASSVVKGKVLKWRGKQSPAAQAKGHNKRHCARAISSGQFAGTTATTTSQGACAEVNQPDAELKRRQLADDQVEDGSA